MGCSWDDAPSLSIGIKYASLSECCLWWFFSPLLSLLTHLPDMLSSVALHAEPAVSLYVGKFTEVFSAGLLFGQIPLPADVEMEQPGWLSRL